MKNKVEKNKEKNTIYFAIILVAVLLISAITVSYAYINIVSGSENKTNTTVTGKTECIDISLANLDETYNLTYNYPITDDFALASDHVKPIRVKITNTCSTGQSDIDYTIVLTSLADEEASSKYIPANKIKAKVFKQLNSTSKTTLINTNLLNQIKTLPESKTKNILNNKLTEKAYSEKYYENYVLDVGKIASGNSITYETYLWIDYSEGNSNNSTEGLDFKSVISVIVNNPESTVTGGLIS